MPRGNRRVVQTAVVFDAMGTLIDLEPLRARVEAAGAPAAALEAWFERILHSGAALTLIEDFRPFPELAASALRTTLAQLGGDPDDTGPLEALSELAPYPDAEPALRVLHEARIPAYVLTNGGDEATRGLLERAGLRGYFADVLSIDETEAFKPHPAPYRMTLHHLGRRPEHVWFVAAHGWDVLGAEACGMRAVWVDRLEREWPFPHAEPRRAASLEEAVRLVTAAVAV